MTRRFPPFAWLSQTPRDPSSACSRNGASFDSNNEQTSLIEETLDTDLVALALEIAQRATTQDKSEKQPPQACRSAARAATRSTPPPARQHHLRLRLKNRQRSEAQYLLGILVTS